VLRDVSLKCPAMQRTAIVGSSGSGKSSILALLERFYEPTGGKVSEYSSDVFVVAYTLY
jgi:ATP-binding cassette subfamily B (MDR/TAP) protein 1